MIGWLIGLATFLSPLAALVWLGTTKDPIHFVGLVFSSLVMLGLGLFFLAIAWDNITDWLANRKGPY